MQSNSSSSSSNTNTCCRLAAYTQPIRTCSVDDCAFSFSFDPRMANEFETSQQKWRNKSLREWDHRYRGIYIYINSLTQERLSHTLRARKQMLKVPTTLRHSLTFWMPQTKWPVINVEPQSYPFQCEIRVCEN